MPPHCTRAICRTFFLGYNITTNTLFGDCASSGQHSGCSVWTSIKTWSFNVDGWGLQLGTLEEKGFYQLYNEIDAPEYRKLPKEKTTLKINRRP